LQKILSKNEQYLPAEDTFFIAKHLKNETGKTALDIGTGSGYLAKILSTQFSFVVATDIDFHSLKFHNPKITNSVCCNSADPIRCEFDLVVCNMPYLPSKKISDQTVDGGKEGLEIPFKIIKSAKNCIKKRGKFLFLTSSLANYQELIKKTKRQGFSVRIIARKKLFFEELILIEAKR